MARRGKVLSPGKGDTRDDEHGEATAASRRAADLRNLEGLGPRHREERRARGTPLEKKWWGAAVVTRKRGQGWRRRRHGSCGAARGQGPPMQLHATGIWEREDGRGAAAQRTAEEVGPLRIAEFQCV
jgi:hypothetical protein